MRERTAMATGRAAFTSTMKAPSNRSVARFDVLIARGPVNGGHFLMLRPPAQQSGSSFAPLHGAVPHPR